MFAAYAIGAEIKPRVRHILSWKNILSFADSKRARCQLLEKEWALNTGKLLLGGLPRNNVVKLGDSPNMTSDVLMDVKQIKQTKTF